MESKNELENSCRKCDGLPKSRPENVMTVAKSRAENVIKMLKSRAENVITVDY